MADEGYGEPIYTIRHEHGALYWTERPGKTFECHLDVEAGHRRRGIGRDLITALEAEARQRGGMSIYSFCAGDNAAALAFFQACGFSASVAWDFYGKGRDAYFLWKTIGRPA